MNKSELIDAVAEATGLSKTDSGKAVEAVFGGIESALKAGDEVRLPGFGTFAVKNRPARTGKNPRTGEPVEIAAAKAAAFKPGKGLKDALNG
ncbi:hypothetical protein TSO5_16270 [Azospirillum sp. TSO5]|nr:hypothetical protein TSO5_16270 [Azospirillum sp. TSO5]